MRHLTYLAVLVGCLAGALWLEPVLRVGILRQWRRLLLTLAPVVLIFGGWDLAAIRAHHWRYDPAQTVDILLPGHLPVEELLFFLVVPVCAVLGFEAVRTVLDRRSVAPPSGEPPGGEPPNDEPPRGVADRREAAP